MSEFEYYNAEAARAANEDITFSFGANWKRFLSQFDEAMLLQAERSLVEFTKMARLDGHDFLDLGSGSGLSSLAAIRLGARRVVSVDIDPNSVACGVALRQQFGVPEHRWQIQSGSVLDPIFLESLGRYSYVHSWGVLH